jgi:hypothetical protein
LNVCDLADAPLTGGCLPRNKRENACGKISRIVFMKCFVYKVPTYVGSVSHVNDLIFGKTILNLR